MFPIRVLIVFRREKSPDLLDDRVVCASKIRHLDAGQLILNGIHHTAIGMCEEEDVQGEGEQRDECEWVENPVFEKHREDARALTRALVDHLVVPEEMRERLARTEAVDGEYDDCARNCDAEDEAYEVDPNAQLMFVSRTGAREKVREGA